MDSQLATANNRRAVVFPSELGWMAAVLHGPRLTRFTFGYDDSIQARTLGLPADNHQPLDQDEADEVGWFVERLQRYATGTTDDLLDIELDLTPMTSFQREVVEQCRRIPFGSTCTYAQLSARAGRPGAARAVGQVMAGNRFPLIVPCHRVVGSGGALGGYSAPQGLRMKRLLLERERALADSAV